MKIFISFKPTCFRSNKCTHLIIYSTFILLNQYVTSQQTGTEKSCSEYFEKGVEAYLENNFADCVTHLENALSKYHHYSKNIQNCRLKCKDEAEESTPLYPVDVENLLFYERTLRTTLCLVKCKKEFVNDKEKYDMNEDLELLFEKRKPYEYLHVCYFQMKDIQKAASSAFTYLVAHPEDKTMNSTLKYYYSFEGVDSNAIVNYEARDYVYLYTHGNIAYEEKNWMAVIDNMEESLSDFLQAEEECRAQCEGSFDHGWFPDFVPSIANHFTYCLNCKHKCYFKLSSINGEKYDDLLPSHYHYLQYAYFKVGKFKEACQAVESYLLFMPRDLTMIENKEYYSKLPEVQKEFFTPRPEATKYVHRLRYEKQIMKFIDGQFKFNDQLEEEISKNTKQLSKLKKKSNLKGGKRFVSEGTLSKKQCTTLLNLIRTFSKVGDGYDTGSPHTEMEKFEGLTLRRLLSLVHLGLLNSKYLRMLLEVTEDAKETIRRKFKIEEPLYFTFTHLVCRYPLKDGVNRTDLSHEVHADNCNILPSGECERAAPSYTWRDFSAIMYLNDDIEGGELFFTQNITAESIQESFSPKCGKMVAFSSGKENLHGVKAVRKGRRYSLGLWFTLDPTYREKERDLAYELLGETSEN